MNLHQEVETSEMKTILRQFMEQSNKHPSLKTLTQNWNRTLLLQITDTQEDILLKIENHQWFECSNIEDKDKAQIILRAEFMIMKDIFQGHSSPVERFFAGDLECFASDEDQVKLDALCLVLWGI
jgi:hypothetical protein